jgi:hypothetical protein
LVSLCQTIFLYNLKVPTIWLILSHFPKTFMDLWFCSQMPSNFSVHLNPSSSIVLITIGFLSSEIIVSSAFVNSLIHNQTSVQFPNSRHFERSSWIRLYYIWNRIILWFLH